MQIEKQPKNSFSLTKPDPSTNFISSNCKDKTNNISDCFIVFIYLMSIIQNFSYDKPLKESEYSYEVFDSLLYLMLSFLIANLLLIILFRLFSLWAKNKKQSITNKFKITGMVLKYLKSFLFSYCLLIISLKLRLEYKESSEEPNTNDYITHKNYYILNKNYALNLLGTNMLIFLSYRGNKIITITQIIVMLLPNFINLIFFNFLFCELANFCFSVIVTFFVLFIRRNIYNHFTKDNKITKDSNNNKNQILSTVGIKHTETTFGRSKNLGNYFSSSLLRNKTFNFEENLSKIFCIDLLNNNFNNNLISHKLKKFLNLNSANCNENNTNNLNEKCNPNAVINNQNKESYVNDTGESNKNPDIDVKKKLNDFLEDIKFFKISNKYLKSHNFDVKNNNNDHSAKDLKEFLDDLIKEKKAKLNDIRENSYPSYFSNKDLKGEIENFKIEDKNEIACNHSSLTLNKGESLLILVNEIKNLVSVLNLNNNKKNDFLNENLNKDAEYSLDVRAGTYKVYEGEIKLDFNNTSCQNIIQNENKSLFLSFKEPNLKCNNNAKQLKDLKELSKSEKNNFVFFENYKNSKHNNNNNFNNYNDKENENLKTLKNSKFSTDSEFEVRGLNKPNNGSPNSTPMLLARKSLKTTANTNFNSNEKDSFSIITRVINIGIFIYEGIEGNLTDNPSNQKTNNKQETKYFDVFLIFHYTSFNSEIIKLELMLKDVSHYFYFYEKIRNKFKTHCLHLSKLIHEFKTPLNCIIGLSAELQSLTEGKVRTKPNKGLYDDLERIEHLSHYTVFLIKDLMNYLGKTNKQKKGHLYKDFARATTTRRARDPKPVSFEDAKKTGNFNNCDNNENNNLKNENTIKDSNIHFINEIGEKAIINYASKDNDDQIKNSFLNITKSTYKSHKRSTRNLIQLQTYSLAEILKFSYSILTSLIKCSKLKRENIQPVLNIAEDLKQTSVSTDDIKLKQILLNLISNAVKFTHSGLIEIEAKYDHLANKRYVVIVIRDTGIGISKSEQHKIFTDYSNIKIEAEKKIDNQMGTGLGLSLSKNIASLLGMQLLYDQKYKDGSKFSVLIPIEKCSFNNSNNSVKNNLNNFNSIHNPVNLNPTNLNCTNNYSALLGLENKKTLSSGVQNFNNNKSNLKNNNRHKRFSVNYNLHVNGTNPLVPQCIWKQDTDSLLTKIQERNRNILNSKKSLFLLNNKGNAYDLSFNEKSDSLMGVGETENKIRHSNLRKKTRRCLNSVMSGFDCSTDKKNRNFVNFIPETNMSEIKSTQNSAHEGTIIYNCNTTRTITMNKFIEFNIHPSIKRDFYESQMKDRNYECSRNNSNFSQYSDDCDKTTKKMSLAKSKSFEVKPKDSLYSDNEDDIENIMTVNDRFDEKQKAISNRDLIRSRAPKILIVDDNEILLRTLKKMLTDLLILNNEEYEILTANDGVSILNYIIEDQFNGNLIKCIITDENMEFINGTEAVGFLAKLRMRNKIRNVSVIFLSSYDNDCFLSGIPDVFDCELMSKPISIKELQGKLVEMEIFKYNAEIS